MRSVDGGLLHALAARCLRRRRGRGAAQSAEVAEGAAEALEGVADLAGHDPELVGVALGDLRQHLEVLVGEELLVRVSGVDGLEDRTDGLGLAFRAEGGGARLTFGAEDRGLLLTLGPQDLGLADTFGLEDGGALVAVGAHLLLHRVLDGGGRLDRLQLDTVDADAPLAGGLVEDAAQRRVDLLAGGQRPLQVHAADDVAEGGDGELLDGLDVAGHLVGGGPGVGHLVVDDGVDVDDQVVLGDDGLRGERHDLLAEVDAVADRVDEGDDDVEARVEGAGVAAEALDDGGAGLRDDLDRLDQGDEDEHHQNDQDDDDRFHRGSPCLSCLRGLVFPPARRAGGSWWPSLSDLGGAWDRSGHMTTAVAPSMSTTSTSRPGSYAWSASRARADQISPASLIRPPEPSTRSTTTACLPLRASTPVTVPGEWARLRAAMGRTTAINATETTTKTSTWATMPPPSPAVIAAATAPTANMPNSGMAVITSGMPRATAPTSHHTHASMSTCSW
ncbi:RTX toxin [Streptomyces sp. FR-008]|nr:RTX toxin [Streptomyces sp. FR-008]